MPIDDAPDIPWRRLVAELQDSQAEQRQPWGAVDDLLIARYLAGECDEQEHAAVERASRSFPELRECIALASESLNAVCAPVLASQELEIAAAATAKVGPRKAGRVSVGRWIWRFASAGSVPNWAAAACVLVAAGFGWRLTDRMDSLAIQLSDLLNRPQITGQAVAVAPVESKIQSLQDKLEGMETEVVHIAHRQNTLTDLQSRINRQVSALASSSRIDTERAGNLVDVTPDARVLQLSPILKEHGIEERVATAVRGYCRISRLVPYVACRTVAEDISAMGSPVRTTYRTVCETASREEVFTLPRNIQDNPPMLPAEELLPALTHQAELVQWAAADALSRAATGELRTKARTAIVETLKKRDDLGATAADYVLTGRIAEGFGTDLSKAAMEALSSPDKIPRWAGLHYFLVVSRCFADNGPTIASPTGFPDVFAAELVRQLVGIVRQKEEYPVLRKAAVYLLGQYGAEAKPALNDLVQILEGDGDPQTRRWAAYAIGQMGSGAENAGPRLGRVLVKEATNPDGKIDETVFPAVAYAYGELCGGNRQSNEQQEVVVVLIDCLGDSDPNVSYWSAYALWRINEPAVRPCAYGSDLQPVWSAPPTYSSPERRTVLMPATTVPGGNGETVPSLGQQEIRLHPAWGAAESAGPARVSPTSRDVDFGGWRPSRD